MSSLTSFTRTNGDVARISWYEVTAVRSDPDDANRCYIYDLHQAPNTEPWHIAATPAAALTTLATAAGGVASDASTAPFFGINLVNGDTLSICTRNLASVREDPDNANRCYIFLAGQTRAFHAAETVADVVTFANAADPAAGAGPGMIIAGGVVDGATGAVSSAFGGLTANGAYTPGSGDYGLIFSAQISTVLVLITPLGAAAPQNVFAYEVTAPGTLAVHADVIPTGVWPDTTDFAVAVVRTA